MHQDKTTMKRQSVLASLRALVPECEITDYRYVLNLVERQAEVLLDRYGRSEGATPSDIVTLFPRVRVVYTDDLPSSGTSRWNGSHWVIFVRRGDVRTRQRFTLAHELAHIIHHGHIQRLFTGRDWLPDAERTADADKQRERAADHFAGCLLMPRAKVFILWARGVRTPTEIAEYFDVSEAAAKVRLEQLELIRPRWFCTRGLQSYTDRPGWAAMQRRTA